MAIPWTTLLLGVNKWFGSVSHHGLTNSAGRSQTLRHFLSTATHRKPSCSTFSRCGDLHPHAFGQFCLLLKKTTDLMLDLFSSTLRACFGLGCY